MKKLFFVLAFLLSTYVFAGTFDEQYITYKQCKITYYEEQLVRLENVDSVLSVARKEVAEYIKSVPVGYTINIDNIGVFVIRMTETDYKVVVIYTLLKEDICQKN